MLADDSKAAAVFRDVSPIFKAISVESFFEMFGHLYDLLMLSICRDKAEKYRPALSSALQLDPTAPRPLNGANVRNNLVWFLRGCIDVLSVTGLEPTIESKISFPIDATGGHTHVTPDIIVSYEGTPLIVIEGRYRGLDKFVTSDRRLDSSNERFRKIFKQCCTYMYATKLPNIFLTDFQTTIFFKLDITKEQEGRATDDEFSFDCQYHVIKQYDTPVTLQAVITSMLLYEFGIQATNDY